MTWFFVGLSFATLLFVARLAYKAGPGPEDQPDPEPGDET